MASNCDLDCFSYKCSIPINVLSGDLTDVRGDLDSMARCMTHVCALDYLGKNTTELAQVYQQLLSAKAPFMNDTVGLTNCPYNEPLRVWGRYVPKYIVHFYGYICPIIILLTVITNSLVIIVLMKPHMRSPTNVFLVAMALSDSFTGLWQLPVFLHFHATKRFYEWVPYNWCYPYFIFGDYLPTIFHTVSIWLTVALTVQRYICVCHPLKARTWCTVRNAVYGTVVIYVIATLTNIARFFEFHYEETEITSLLRPSQYVSACVYFVAISGVFYYIIYIWFRIIFVHSLPCLSVIMMNALLINTLRVARRRRQQLLGQHMDSERRKLEQSNSSTLMLVVVVFVFLLVEIPTTIYFIIFFMGATFDITVMEHDTVDLCLMVTNFGALLSYPTNFFIYCSMCKKFRDTFKQLLATMHLREGLSARGGSY